ncbi:M15 family metallopeptidase [Cellulomonas sp. NPDC089187]|uniref:M15 family metallopeptidase n=1 Tax=Cellulomonas sp. NPDC089187 TaxID=3154970 RepID=UPI003427FB13
MEKPTRLGTVLILLLALVLAGLGAWWGMGHARPAEAQEPGVPPVSVVDERPEPTPEEPVVTAIDPELMRRFQLARDDAAADGLLLMLTSGWRSAADQQELVDEAIAKYGDPAEAHRWVLPPEKSAHVQGTAIDVGSTDAAIWLGERQEQYGLCRTYANEMWHFELVGEVGDPCPQMWPDASHGWS